MIPRSSVAQREQMAWESGMRSKNLWVVAMIVIIWLFVLLTSLTAPELMWGEEPVILRPAALINWFWGLVATVFILRSTYFRHPNEMGWGQTDAYPWITGVIAVVWLVAFLASGLAPEVRVNEDILIPVASIVAPPIAVAITLYATEFLITGFASRQPLNAE